MSRLKLMFAPRLLNQEVLVSIRAAPAQCFAVTNAAINMYTNRASYALANAFLGVSIVILVKHVEHCGAREPC